MTKSVNSCVLRPFEEKKTLHIRNKSKSNPAKGFESEGIAQRNTVVDEYKYEEIDDEQFLQLFGETTNVSSPSHVLGRKRARIKEQYRQSSENFIHSNVQPKNCKGLLLNFRDAEKKN